MTWPSGSARCGSARSARGQSGRSVASTRSSSSGWRSAPLREQARLLDLAHDSILVRSYADHQILFWNRGAEKTYGWTAREALGRDPAVLFQTRFPRPLAEMEAELLATGSWEGELEHARKDGERITVASRWAVQRDAAGQPQAILQISRDITEHKRAQQALQHSEAQLRRRSETRGALLRAARHLAAQQDAAQ